MNLSDIIQSNSRPISSLFSNNANATKSIERCITCKGKGFIPVSKNKGHSRGIEVEEHECTTCQGSGLIDVEITVKIKPHKPNRNESQDH